MDEMIVQMESLVRAGYTNNLLAVFGGLMLLIVAIMAVDAVRDGVTPRSWDYVVEQAQEGCSLSTVSWGMHEQAESPVTNTQNLFDPEAGEWVNLPSGLALNCRVGRRYPKYKPAPVSADALAYLHLAAA